MGLHRNLAGDDLHDPKGKFPSPLDIDDDTPDAYKIYEVNTSNSYLSINTTDSAENVTVGNTTTNPTLVHAGTGNVGLGTDSPQEKLHIHDGNFLLHNDSGGSMTMTFARDNTGSGFGTSNKIYQFTTPADMSKTTLQVGTAGSTVDAISVNSDGTFHIVKESSTPSSPGAGKGGYVYVKTDGKLYFRSDSTTETDLTASSSGGLAAVVDDPAPKLGANLDCNGKDIILEGSEKIELSGGSIDLTGGVINATTGKGIHDEVNNEQLLFSKTTSAINHFQIKNAAIGGEATNASTAPIFSTIGDDTNIDLALLAKGTGTVTVRSAGTNSATLTLNDEANTNAVNITVPLADELGASYTLTLPPNDGNANDVLQSDGSGNLSWVPQSGGGLTVESQNSTTALTGTNKFVKADSSGAAITLTLPAASTAGSGAIFVIKDIGNASTNAITLEGNGSETIDGALNKIIATNFASIEVICDGSNWFIR